MHIGWIGTGIMGRALCEHLGPDLTLHTRTPAKARELLQRGARWADSARDVAAQCDIIFTMVGTPADVRDVYFGPTGLLAGARPGAITVDMTTSAPTLAREIYDAARARGVSALDAPVSGGDVGARQATLSIMVGGDRAAFEAVLPLLQKLGKTIVHHGPAGAGQHAKLCNQIVIAGTMIGICEALLYATGTGLEPARVLESIRGGAAGCWSLDHLAPRILRGDFAPGFQVDHFLKDLGLALQEARQRQLNLPGLQLAHALYDRTRQHGHGRRGTHALYLALQELAGAAAETAGPAGAVTGADDSTRC
jgi:3-hydroxyisobutyrate dehydrogenase